MRRTLRRAGRWLPWVLAAVLLLFLIRRVYPAVDLEQTARPAPDFALADLEGELFRLSDHRGKVIVLNFWATWCPPCRAEIPAFIGLQDEFREAGVLFVGISLDEEGAAVVAPFVEARGVNYPILPNGQAVAAQFGGVHALPTTLLIDRAGQIRFRHEGFLLPQALRRPLQQLAGEVPRTGA